MAVKMDGRPTHGPLHRSLAVRLVLPALIPRGAHWEVSVQDDGPGIDPRHHDRIFVLLQRLHRHDEVEGTGMGLAICKRIVESHGGRIWVESREGEGARFTFALPAAHDGPPRPRPEAPVAAGAA